MVRDKQSTTAELPVLDDKQAAPSEPGPASARPASEAEPASASFRDADDHTLDLPLSEPPLGVEPTPLNVRWPDEPLIESLPDEAEGSIETDFDSVEIAVDDLNESAPPAPFDAHDEDVVIESAGGPLSVEIDLDSEGPAPSPRRPVMGPELEEEPSPSPEPPTPEPRARVSLVSPITPAPGAEDLPLPEPGGPITVAVGGGKGGVGRSLLVANLGLFMAHLGRDVVACDLAPDGANLHTFLGLEPRLPTTGMMLRGAGGPHVETFPGLRLRLCRSAVPIAMGADDPLRRRTLDHARALAPQVLLLDLGTHADPLSLDNFNDADAAIVVVTPEPIAMERTYAFLRAALYRRLLFGDDEPAVVARALLAGDHVGQLDTPGDLVAAMKGVNPKAAQAIAERVRTFSPLILLNHCRSRADRQLGKGMVSALRHRWGITAEVVGALEHDDAAVEASRRRRPLMMEYPGSTLGASIDRLARRLVSVNSRREAWT